MSSSTPSTTTPPNQDATTTADQESTPSSSSNHQPLPLPEPAAADKDESSPTRQLNVNGEGIKLDHLGPLVVHQDGTMSRIGNWGEMSELERENTLRIIGLRNQQRLKKLREEGNSAGDAAATNADETGKQQ